MPKIYRIRAWGHPEKDDLDIETDSIPEDLYSSGYTAVDVALQASVSRSDMMSALKDLKEDEDHAEPVRE